MAKSVKKKSKARPTVMIVTSATSKGIHEMSIASAIKFLKKHYPIKSRKHRTLKTA